MEIFYSIQGEGFYTGTPATFIRLGGCDVGCVWCDVKESWNENDHPFLTIQEIVKAVSQYESKILILTGGEPLMYDLSALTFELKSSGFQLHLETSGVYPVTGEWDWVCFSPKKFKKPHDSIYPLADEVKAIVFNQSDFAFAEENVSRTSDDCLKYLQPEWSKTDQMTPLIIDYVKSHPEWNISLQTHKYLNIP